MAVDERFTLPLPEGYRSREVASFIAQFDDLTRRLREDLAGITPDELAWQPAPGMNTIGMLLAHVAVVEVAWTQAGILGRIPPPFREILGIERDGDGMPLAAQGRPPASLEGRDLAYFEDLIARARTQLKEGVRHLSDDDLARVVTRVRAERTAEIDHRWLLYHMLEHLAGHYGQILLLRHQYRARPEPGAPGRRAAPRRHR